MTLDIKKYFGLQVKKRRLAMELNQTHFAQIVGLTRTSVINLETGRHTPPLTGFFQICEVLGCQPNDLLPVAKKAKLVSKKKVKVIEKVYKEYKPLK